MRVLILFLVTIVSLSSCFNNQANQAATQAVSNPPPPPPPRANETKSLSVTLLSDQEITELNKSEAKTINLSYDADINVSKEVTIKEYVEILKNMKAKTTNQEIYDGLQAAYTQLSMLNPDSSIMIPSSVSVLGCGGCGCVTPGKAGQPVGTGNTWWCACCP